jgi:hypothetical protein
MNLKTKFWIIWSGLQEKLYVKQKEIKFLNLLKNKLKHSSFFNASDDSDE